MASELQQQKLIFYINTVDMQQNVGIPSDAEKVKTYQVANVSFEIVEQFIGVNSGERDTWGLWQSIKCVLLIVVSVKLGQNCLNSM